MEKNGEGFKADDQVEPTGEQGVETSSGAPAEEQVDWQELLRIERDRAEKAERDRDNYKDGLLTVKGKRKQQEEAPDNDELDDKIARGLAKALEPLATQLGQNKTDSILTSLVADPSKREVVKFFYENRIQRTGTSDEAIRADLGEALALADSKRISKENEELKRMNDNRTYVPPSGGGGSPGTGVPRKPYQWTPEQERALEDRARSVGIADVEKYKERAWQQLQTGTAFSVQPKPKS